MPLPVLNARGGATPNDLLRFFARTELHWSRHVAEDAALDFGVALTSREFPGVFFANRMIDVALPDDVTPAQAFDAAAEHFVAAGTRCYCWTMDPAAAESKTRPMGEYLVSRGFQADAHDVMYLQGAPTSPIVEVGGLSIIPARASFRHTRQLLDEWNAKWSPQVSEASMLHLDDSHTDALIAMRDGVPAAYVAVLSAGDVGAIEELFVSEAFRKQGIGRTMMSRALEICARSQFRHVFVEVTPSNVAARSLYEACGFRKIGEVVTYDDPVLQARP